MIGGLIGPGEVAAVLGVHRTTAHKWITSGQLGAWVRLPDGSPRIARAQAQEWVKAHTFSGPAPVLFSVKGDGVKRRRVKG